METKTISVVVAEQLSELGSKKVVDSVVNILVNKEIENRSTLLLSAIKQFEELNKQLNKIQPDMVSYNEDGTKVASNWSKQKLEEKRKIEEKIKKIDNAVNKATEQNDWSSINNLGNKDENNGKSNE